ncbi:MAG TPA: tail fiber protein [Acetobacteraceae bacterium]|nr:tail fiber protein [Acetobacteraceae bacterium]
MSQPFLGQITLFPYTFPPRGWADCQGQLMPISQNTALFSLLGTTYGGDGRTTFALPDLQGRAAVGQGTLSGGSVYGLGEQTGSENVGLIPQAMPAHNHALNATTSQGTTNTPSGALLATAALGPPRQSNRGNVYNAATPSTGLVGTSVAPAGGGQPHNNVQPSLVLRYCIAISGVFPSRQ